MKTNMKLCVSLDLESSKENLALVEKIKDFDIWLKVGFRTYLRDGKKFLEDLKSINPNFKIFWILNCMIYQIQWQMQQKIFQTLDLLICLMFMQVQENLRCKQLWKE